MLSKNWKWIHRTIVAVLLFINMSQLWAKQSWMKWIKQMRSPTLHSKYQWLNNRMGNMKLQNNSCEYTSGSLISLKCQYKQWDVAKSFRCALETTGIFKLEKMLNMSVLTRLPLECQVHLCPDYNKIIKWAGGHIQKRVQNEGTQSSILEKWL